MDYKEVLKNERQKSLKKYLMVCETMKADFEHRKRRAESNAYETGSDKSYKTMHKWEDRLAVLKFAEKAIYEELGQ